jgi:hypothetical protein
MKPIKFKKKLRFHKETIADLHSKEMEAVHGGIEDPLPAFTYTKCRTQCPSLGSAIVCCAYC